MRILPVDPIANASHEALADFLLECRGIAERAERPQLVSISVAVDSLDPLAVLESIFEAGELHFYVEKPSEHLAVAGAEAVLSFRASGSDRFAACQAFIDETLAHALAVGAVDGAFGGPQFFTAFTFLDQPGVDEPFPAVQVFVPRWQVGCRDGATVATANLLVGPGDDVRPLVERVWRAHAKFRVFDYGHAEFPTDTVAPVRRVEEVGGVGRYREAVARALHIVGSGQVEKIVLARAQDLHGDGSFHPLRALNGLRERFRECYAFSVGNGAGASFIGASPERLLRVRAGRLTTEALAGSTRRGATASEDAALGNALLRDDKELREHRVVADSIFRRLAPLGLQLESPARPVLRRLANVQHLHTPIEAALPPGVRLLDALARLHPTPAVGGSPREAAVPLIAGLEGFPRGLYAGALGWIDARGDGEFFVGLRSALIAGGVTRLYAGAGIVAGSDPEREYAETELKIRAMRDALGA